MEELEFPIERTRAMKVLGHLWTGSVSGQIIVGTLLFIGVLFMGTQDFSIISLIMFFGFFIPFSFIFHVRFVKRGKQLMTNVCYIQIKSDEKILNFKSGFPNTNNPDWQQVKIDDDLLDVEIRGNDTGGFHIRIRHKDRIKDILRFGLWFDLQQARQNGDKLASLIGRKISFEIKEDPPS